MRFHLLTVLLVMRAIEAQAAPPSHRSAAEAAERQGEESRARDEVELDLDAAGLAQLAAALMATNGRPPDSAALRDAAAFAFAFGARHGDFHLMVRAAAWWPDLAARHPDELRGALLHAPPAADLLPRDVKERLASSRGVADHDSRFDRALAERDLAALRREAELLSALDHAHVMATLALELLGEDPRRLAQAGLDLFELVKERPEDVARDLIRLNRALAENGGDARLRLTLAWRSLEANLAADARREAARALAAGLSPSGRRAAETIDMLAAFDLGQTAPLRTWLSAQVGPPSFFVAGWLLRRYGYDDTLPPEMAAVRRQLVQVMFARPPPDDQSDPAGSWAWNALRDSKLDGATRGRALQSLVYYGGPFAPAARSCTADRLAMDDCVHRLDLVSRLEDEDDDDDDDEEDEAATADLPAALKTLGAHLEVQPEWLERLARVPAPTLIRLRPWLDGLRQRPVAETGSFARLDLLVRWASNDLTGARAALAAVRSRRGRPQRLALQLLALDVEDKVLTPQEASAAYRSPVDPVDLTVSPPANGPEPEWMAQSFPGKHRLSRLLRAVANLGDGRPRLALDGLEPLWKASARLDEEDRATLASYVYLAAAGVPDRAALADQAAGEVERLVPDSDLAARVRSQRATRAGDRGPALEAAWQWAALTDGAHPARLALLAAVAARRDVFTGPSPAARTLLGRASRILNGAFGGPGAVAELETPVTAGCWRALFTDTVEDVLLTCGPEARAAALGATFDVTYRLERRLDKAVEPASIVREARALAAAYEISVRGRPRAAPDISWMRFIAGDPESGHASRAAGPHAVRAAEALALARRLPEAADPAGRRSLFRKLEPVPGLDESQADPTVDLAGQARGATDPRRRALLWHLACLVDDSPRKAHEARASCGQAWRMGERTEGTATALARALFGDLEAARAEGLEAGPFLEQARRALHGKLPADVRAGEAAWLITLGRYEEATRALEDAWAGGAGRLGQGVPTGELATAPFDPALARYRGALPYTRGQRGLALAGASLCAGDAELAATYVRQARLFFRPESDSAREKALAVIEDMGELIAADQKDGLADSGRVSRLTLRLFGAVKQPPPTVDAGDARSALGTLVGIEESVKQGTAKAQVETARKLLARFPHNGLVANDVAVVLRHAGLVVEAAAIWNTARKQLPNSPFLREQAEASAAKPAVAANTAARPQMTKINFAQPEAWEKLLASPIAASDQLGRLQRITNEKLGFDVVVPSGFTESAHPDHGIAYARDGLNLVFMRVPRVTYCEGLPCLDQILPSVEQQGLKRQWRRVFTSAIGPGAESYLTSGGVLLPRAVLVAALPANGYLYLLAAGGPARRLDEAAAIVQMVFASFRPLDLVLPQPIAGRLRGEGVAPPPAVLEARAALVRPPPAGCPLASQRDLTPALLVDAFLSTPWALTRRHLLDCEPQGQPPSAALTLAALWDEDRSVRRLGAARVAASAPEVLAEAKRLLPGDAPIAPPSGSSGSDPDYRWTQLLVALPPRERGDLVAWLLRRDEPHLRAIGLLAPRLDGVELGATHLRVLREGSTAEARIVMLALPPVLSAPVRQALVARLERARAPLADDERGLLVSMAERLGGDQQPGDRPRFTRLLRVVNQDGSGNAARSARGRLEALLRKPARPAPRSPGRSASAPIDLDASLAEIVPARWSYMRIPRPRLLLARLASLARSLKAPSRDRQLLAQSAISRMVGEADLVGADSGEIDLDEPIECAAEDASFSSMICAARRLADRPDAADRTTRALDVLSIVAGGAVALPVVLPALPFVLHQKFYATSNETHEGQKAPFVRESAERWAETRAGRLNATTHLQIDPDGAGTVTDRITLRSGGRLFFANSAWIARTALGDWLSSPTPAGAPVSRPPAPREAAKGDDSADIIASLSSEHVDGPAGKPTVLEVTVSAGGIATRLKMPIRKPAAPASLWSLLPADPALAFALRDVGWSDSEASAHDNSSWLLLSHLDATGVEPPVWLGDATQSLAFGWYPADGGRLWDNWFVAVTWDDRVAAAWRTHGLAAPPADGTAAVGGGYRFKRAGGTVLISNSATLLDQKRAVAREQSDDPARSVFDGGRIARALEQLAARPPAAEVGTALRIMAALTSIIKASSVTSRLDAASREVAVQTLLAPQVEGGAEAALVEEWQGENRVLNTVTLPRILTEDEARHPLTYVIELDHEENIAHVFPATTRQRIEPVAPHRWRLIVAPGPGLDDSVATPAAAARDAERFADASALAPRIRSAANEIVPKGTPPKQAARLVLEWLRRNMTYELTPREVSDEAILETRRGDCTEYSKLAVALLRAKGIPARSRYGFMADGSALVAHEWVEFFDGAAWREIDPTSAGPSVDSRFIDASLADVVPLLSLGRLRIVAVQ